MDVCANFDTTTWNRLDFERLDNQTIKCQAQYAGLNQHVKHFVAKPNKYLGNYNSIKVQRVAILVEMSSVTYRFMLGQQVIQEAMHAWKKGEVCPGLYAYWTVAILFKKLC